MEELINKLEYLMRGLNYCTTFGYKELGTAENIAELKHLIKNTFPDSCPFETDLIEINEYDFWRKIQYGFIFIKDFVNFFKLTPRQEFDLVYTQQKFKIEIKKNINSNTKFYTYPSEEGIPGYVVMWDFRLIYNNNKNNWFFVYGSASD